MKKKYWIVGLSLVLQTLISSPEANASARATKKIGINVGVITEPFPSVLGYGISYNLAQFLRLGVSYGSISATGTTGAVPYAIDLKTLAFDAKGFLIDWNFAPFVNLGYSTISGTVSGTGSASGIGITSAGSSLYYGGGIDWQTYFGFNFGVEYKSLTIAGKAIGLPGVYFGWYF